MKSLKSKLLNGIIPAFIFITSFLPQALFSQNTFTGDYVINTYWDFYTTNYSSTIASGKGYTGIASDKNDIMGITLNPASLNVSKKINAHIEYVYKNKVPHSYANGFEINLRPYIPSVSGGIGYKVNKYIQTGLLFNTESSCRQDLGEWIITNEWGEEIGRGEAFENYSKSVFSLPVVYNYKSTIKAGVTLNYALYNRNFTIPLVGNESNQAKLTASFQKFYPSFGITALPVKNISIGASITPGFKERVILKTEDTPVGTLYDTNATDNIFPLKFGAGVEYRFNKIPLKVSIEYNYTNTSEDSLQKDRHNFNAGLEYTLNEKLILRTGFFTLMDSRKYERPAIYTLGKFDQYFITAGASYKIKKFTVIMAVMDSHISSGSIKQTIVNGGISWEY